jgi:hypothetical protein
MDSRAGRAGGFPVLARGAVGVLAVALLVSGGPVRAAQQAGAADRGSGAPAA